MTKQKKQLVLKPEQTLKQLTKADLEKVVGGSSLVPRQPDA